MSMSTCTVCIYLAEHETEKCPFPRIMILWEDRVGEGGERGGRGGGEGVFDVMGGAA